MFSHSGPSAIPIDTFQLSETIKLYTVNTFTAHARQNINETNLMKICIFFHQFDTHKWIVRKSNVECAIESLYELFRHDDQIFCRLSE